MTYLLIGLICGIVLIGIRVYFHAQNILSVEQNKPINHFQGKFETTIDDVFDYQSSQYMVFNDLNLVKDNEDFALNIKTLLISTSGVFIIDYLEAFGTIKKIGNHFIKYSFNELPQRVYVPSPNTEIQKKLSVFMPNINNKEIKSLIVYDSNKLILDFNHGPEYISFNKLKSVLDNDKDAITPIELAMPIGIIVTHDLKKAA